MKPASSTFRLPETAAWVFLLLSINALAYLPGLSGGFLFDDFPNIVTNPNARVTELTLDSLSTAARAYEPGPYGRPLATISFAFDYYIGGGDPFIYKLHGLLVHILNTCLVFALARSLLSGAGLRPTAESLQPQAAAAILAAAWAIHPLQVSSVLYVVQRMETLAACFTLLSLLAYCKGRRSQLDGCSNGWGWLALSATLATAGLLAKESAAIAPLMTLVLEICLFHFRAASVRTQEQLRFLYALGAVVGTMAIALLFWRYGNPEAYTYREHTPYERLLTQPRVLMMYLKQIIFPIPSAMPFYYDNYPHSTSLVQPWSTAISTMALAGLIGTALWLRQRLPLVALGILWFFAGHALTSGIIPLEHVYEHRNYLPLFGILLAIYASASRIIRQIATPPIARAVPALVLVGLFTITLIRSMTWGSPILLAMEMVASNPGSPRASNDLATLYFSRAEGNPNSREWAMAVHEFKRGMALHGSSPLPEQGLILMNASVGLPAEDEWWDSLIQKLLHRTISPQERMAVTGLLSQAQRGFELDDARLSEAYRVLVERSGLPAYDYCNIGDHALNRIGDQDFGRLMFLACIRETGLDPDFTARTAEVLRMEGHDDIADAILELASAAPEPHTR